jgi:hypothetical protein
MTTHRQSFTEGDRIVLTLADGAEIALSMRKDVLTLRSLDGPLLLRPIATNDYSVTVERPDPYG